jgi:hypothetical protein
VLHDIGVDVALEDGVVGFQAGRELEVTDRIAFFLELWFDAGNSGRLLRGHAICRGLAPPSAAETFERHLEEGNVEGMTQAFLAELLEQS